jgi:hypothetical protein
MKYQFYLKSERTKVEAQMARQDFVLKHANLGGGAKRKAQRASMVEGLKIAKELR